MEFVGSALPITEADLLDAADMLGVELAAVKAVAEVESAGGGFLPDGRPKILFESYQFHRKTGGIFDDTHPAVSKPKWTRDYLGGEKEYDRLAEAIKLNRPAALMSTSWGRFQIMGFNHRAAGFNNVEAFVSAMVEGEPAQLRAFVTLLQNWGLTEALRKRDWPRFAARYNGTGYKANQYDVKLARAYAKHKGEG